MASPRKSGGGRSTPVRKAPKRAEALVEEAVDVAETTDDAAEPEAEDGSYFETAEHHAEAESADAESVDVESAAVESVAVESVQVESVEAEIDPAVGENEPAPPEPVIAQAMEETAHPHAAAEASVDETPVPAAEPAPVETHARIEDEDPVVVVSVREETNMMNVEKIIEAPVASLSEAQSKARTFAEAGLTETRAKFSQFKSAADEAVGAFETSYVTVKSGAVEFNTKALHALKAAADANFEFMKAMLGVKSPSEYVSLHSEFARKQMESLQSHSKAFGELAQKIATESVEPIKAQVAKTLNLPL